MNQERLMKVIVAPHISEKSALAAEAGNQFVFKVATSATKAEVKGAVELMFDVNVSDVRVVNVKGKTKRMGARFGKRKDWKKAYVRLQDGQELEFMSSAS